MVSSYGQIDHFMTWKSEPMPQSDMLGPARLEVASTYEMSNLFFKIHQ